VIVLEIGLALFSITSSSHPKADLWRRSYDRFAEAEIGLIKQELVLDKARAQLAAGEAAAREAEYKAKFEDIMNQRTANWNRLVAEIEPRTLAAAKLPAFDSKNPRQYLEAATALYETRTDSINLFSAFELRPASCSWAGPWP
jgi:hypothetical protein